MAIADPGGQHVRGRHRIEVRSEAELDFIAHEVVQHDCALACAVASADQSFCERVDLRVIDQHAREHRVHRQKWANQPGGAREERATTVGSGRGLCHVVSVGAERVFAVKLSGLLIAAHHRHD
jgi:hypothetical protein